MSDYTLPIVASCRRMRARHPTVPMFLFGHSMGGLIALVVELENPAMFDGLILTGPLIHSSEDSTANRALTWVLSSLCPSCSLSSFGLDTKAITKSAEWLEYIQRDPLFYHGGYKFGHGQVVATTVDWVRGEVGGRWRLGRMKSPLLVVQGEEDTLALGTGARELMSRVGSRDKELVVVEGARHHVLLDSPGVVHNILGWVIEHS